MSVMIINDQLSISYQSTGGDCNGLYLCLSSLSHTFTIFIALNFNETSHFPGDASWWNKQSLQIHSRLSFFTHGGHFNLFFVRLILICIADNVTFRCWSIAGFL